MECIYCGSETQVANSRHQKRTNRVWRRRQCQVCGNIFTTLEEANMSSSVLFKRTQSSIEPFSRDKLFLSIYDCLKHRNGAISAASALTETVLAKLLHSVKEASIERHDLVNTVLGVLKRFDKTAAAVYLAYHS